MSDPALILVASDDELRQKFYSLQKREDVADLLELTYSHLCYHVYYKDPAKRYKKFNISKRLGKSRTISAPATSLKIIQRKLNHVLQLIYKQKPSVHGFTLKRSIVTNAKEHVGKKYILNIDLKEFFPTITHKRVRGMFMGKPFGFSFEIAELLADICCDDEKLPQGAPTSPVISNMLCARLDSQLQTLAKQHRCYYTRYADDITFSTYISTFPIALASINSAGQAEVGGALGAVITNNGFEVNTEKVRLQTKSQRQEVTGIVVNKKANVSRRYVNQIRAMLHDWKMHGPDHAQDRYFEHIDKSNRRGERRKDAFRYVVKGKIMFVGMVKGKTNPTFLALCKKLWDLDQDIIRNMEVDINFYLSKYKEQNEILETCRKKLRHLQTILAVEGHRVEYKVIHEIEECQSKVREIKKLFLSWGVIIEDELVDELKP